MRVNACFLYISQLGYETYPTPLAGLFKLGCIVCVCNSMTNEACPPSCLAQEKGAFALHMYTQAFKLYIYIYIYILYIHIYISI